MSNSLIGFYDGETDSWEYREMTDEEVAAQDEMFATMPAPEIIEEPVYMVTDDDFGLPVADSEPSVEQASASAPGDNLPAEPTT